MEEIIKAIKEDTNYKGSGLNPEQTGDLLTVLSQTDFNPHGFICLDVQEDKGNLDVILYSNYKGLLVSLSELTNSDNINVHVWDVNNDFKLRL